MTPEQIIANSIPEPNTGCFLWLGGASGGGYGVFKVDGRTVYAHRIVCDCPPDKYAIHSCDQPSCVNPDHLRHGTQFDNMDDRRKRGRAKNGNTDKTRCIRGHELSGWNLYLRPDGFRCCRTCLNESVRRWRERNPGWNKTRG